MQLGAPHLTWDISIGQIAISIPIFWVIFMLSRIFHMLLNFRIEHEILMRDWGSRQVPPVKLEDMPTRRNRWW